MSSRNTKRLEGIEEVKRRGQTWSDSVYGAQFAVKEQLDSLLRSAAETPVELTELWKYFPIAAVTCLENAARWSIRHLIDSGDPYEKNAPKLVSGQFSLQELLPLVGRKITLSELVSRLVSVNNLRDIVSSLSSLMGNDENNKPRDFLSELKSAQPFDKQVGVISTLEQRSLLLPNPEVTKPAIQKLFELRHILVHELTPPDVLKTDEVLHLLHQAHDFIVAVTDFVLELGGTGSSALTQSAMTIGAGVRQQEARTRMNEAYKILHERLENWKQKRSVLAASQRQWLRYYAAELRLYLNPYEGGTAGPMMRRAYGEQVINSRTKVLAEHIEQLDWISSL